MKKSFSLLELIIVLIVVGILYSSISFSLSNSSLNQAADQIISHINYARHLAIKDNKMQYYPLNSNEIEMNRSKYWFKQWWQIRFSNDSTDGYWYEIFTDLPADGSTTNFEGTGGKPNKDSDYELTYAKNPNGKYMTGKCDDGTNYVKCGENDKKLNLTKEFSIKKIIFNNLDSTKPHIIFDNYGNVYLTEGDKSDGGDINPYDKDKRVALLKTGEITLCQDDNCEYNISICISPKIGNAYLCK